MSDSSRNVSNVIQILGAEEDVEEVSKYISSENSDFDFSKVYPVPYILQKDRPQYNGTLQSIMEIEKHNNILTHTFSNMPNTDLDFRAWEVEMFGCIGGNFNIKRIKKGIIKFTTFGNVPYRLYIKLAEKFPNITIRGYYIYEHTNTCGICFIQNGKTFGDYKPELGTEEYYGYLYYINEGNIEMTYKEIISKGKQILNSKSKEFEEMERRRITINI